MTKKKVPESWNQFAVCETINLFFFSFFVWNVRDLFQCVWTHHDCSFSFMNEEKLLRVVGSIQRSRELSFPTIRRWRMRLYGSFSGPRSLVAAVTDVRDVDPSLFYSGEWINFHSQSCCFLLNWAINVHFQKISKWVVYVLVWCFHQSQHCYYTNFRVLWQATQKKHQLRNVMTERAFNGTKRVSGGDMKLWLWVIGLCHPTVNINKTQIASRPLGVSRELTLVCRLSSDEEKHCDVGWFWPSESMYMQNKKGPRIEPCGTPQVIQTKWCQPRF